MTLKDFKVNVINLEMVFHVQTLNLKVYNVKKRYVMKGTPAEENKYLLILASLPFQVLSQNLPVDWQD